MLGPLRSSMYEMRFAAMLARRAAVGVGIDVVGARAAAARRSRCPRCRRRRRCGGRAVDSAAMPGVLDRLPGDLEQPALLRIHAHRFARRDPQNAASNMSRLSTKPPRRVTIAPGAAGIRMIEAVDVPAVRRHLADAAAPFDQQRQNDRRRPRRRESDSRCRRSRQVPRSVWCLHS